YDDEVLVEKAFAIMRDWADGILFNEDDVINERGVIVEEERMRSNYKMRVLNQTIKFVLADSLYAERNPIGKTEIIKNADKALLEGFYKKWYTAGNMSIAVVGNIEPEKAVEFIKKYFSSMEKSETSNKVDKTVPIKEGVRVQVISDPEAKGLSATVTYLDKGSFPQTYDDYKLSLLQTGGSSMFNKRMSLKINEKKSSLLSFVSSISPFNDNLLLSSFTAEFQDGKFNESLKELVTEIERVRRHGFTADELKEHHKAKEVFFERASSADYKHSSAKYIGAICNYDTFGGYLMDFDQEKDLYEKFHKDTDLKDFNKAFDNIVSSSSVILTVVVPERDKDSIKIDAASFEKMLKDAKKAKIAPYEYHIGNVQLIKENIKAGTIKSKTPIEEINAVEVVYSNGVKVIIRRNNEEKNTFAMTAAKLGGLSSLNDEELLLFPVMVQGITSSGFKDVTERQLKSYLSAVQTKILLHGDREAFFFFGSGDTRDMEVFFSLLYKYFTSPEINKDTLSVILADVENTLKNNELDKKVQFKRETYPKIYQSYRRDYLLQEDLKKVQYDKLMALYEKCFADAENFTFVISTDKDVDEVIALGAKYLGSLKPLGKKVSLIDRGVAVKNGVAQGYGDVENKTEVSIYISKPVKGDNFTSYKMFIAEILLNIRLRNIIREEMSGVYSIYLMLDYNHVPFSNFKGRIQFVCDPARKDELLKKINEILEDFIENGITDKELEGAKKVYENYYDTLYKSNKGVATHISLIAATKEEFRSLDDINKIIYDITVKDVNATINHFLKNSNMFTWSYGPEKSDKKQ
ncbi:MAG: insulinase family protein, partial [Deferribacterales bacterium]|nr:insulinase family protein [Deferribacterales bacterium]